MLEMTRNEAYDRLNDVDNRREYGKRYEYLLRTVPNDLRRATSWRQIEERPHLWFQFMIQNKGLWYWDKKGFIK